MDAKQWGGRESHVSQNHPVNWLILIYYSNLFTGTGAIALFCAMQGASLVHAIDINPNAVANARANFEKHNFKEDRCLAYHSDLFENISREFDVIHFNPPFQGFRAKNMLDRALTDENYSTVTRFMSGVGGHLSEGGIICVTWSDLGDMTLIERLIEDNGFVVESFFEEQREWSSFLIGLKRKCYPTMTY